jgi:hypothetical protein
MARKPRVERFRRQALTFDKKTVATRIQEFYDHDMHDREAGGGDFEMRRQRYAKYRQWRDPDHDDEFSDTPIPDMMASSSHLQDVLHNAVMSTNPPISSEVTNGKQEPMQETLDSLLHTQMFHDQPGERMIADMAEDFVNEGVMTLFVPWIKDFRAINEVRWFNPLAEQEDETGEIPEAIEYFRAIVANEFPNHAAAPTDKEGWDWRIARGFDDVRMVSFYTDEKTRKIQMVIKWEAKIFDGPRPRVMDYDKVLYPVRAENLQAPSPSNPNGAGHVILIDHPKLGEIENLRRRKFYDLITKADVEKMVAAPQDRTDDETETQKDDFAGHDGQVEQKERREDNQLPVQKTLTRLVCFDTFDLEGDGVERDVVWWYLLETKTVLKAVVMTEFWPANPPHRPLFGDSFMNVKGRYAGIGLLEMMEATHDLRKENFDQMVDAGDVENTPFFFYKSTSNLLNERIRLAAGTGYPLADPQRDVHFPRVGNNGQAYRFNMDAVTSRMNDELTNIGPLQRGDVPRGKASALRTTANFQAAVSAGEARPERILRRYFGVMADMYQWTHNMNRHFLPKNKQIRLVGPLKPGADPYKTINRDDIEADARFTFSATMLNVNKSIVGDILQQLFGLYVNELTVQAGIIQPEGIYRLLRDIGQALGQNPDNYLSAPSPAARQPKILADEAIVMILEGDMPNGVPEEGFEAHLQRLQEFIQQDQAGQVLDPATDDDGKPTQQRALTPELEALFMVYVQDVAQRAQADAERQRVIAAAKQAAQSEGRGGGGNGAVPDTGAPPINGGELIDESLPTAGGGASLQ